MHVKDFYEKHLTILHIIILLALSLLAGAYFLLISGGGALDISPDSPIYVSMSQSFLEGQGFRHLYNEPWNDLYKPHVSHYPPGYPLLLAGSTILGFDVRSSEFVMVHALLLSATIFLTALITRQLKVPFLISIFSIPLMVANQAVFPRFIYLLSEPLFLPLILGATFFLLEYYQKNNSYLLIISGFLVGLAWITRYAAISIVPTMIVIVLLAGKCTFKKRMVKILLFVVFAVGPFVVLTIYNNQVAPPLSGGHSLAWEPLIENWRLLRSALYQIYGAPIEFSGAVIASLPFLIAGTWTGLQTQLQRINHDKLPFIQTVHRLFAVPEIIVLIIFSAYLFFIIVGGTFASFIIDLRKIGIVYPFYVVLTLRSVEAVRHLSPKSSGLILTVASSGLVFMLLDERQGVRFMGLSYVLIVGTLLLYYGYRRLYLKKGVPVHHLILLILLVISILAQSLSLFEYSKNFQSTNSFRSESEFVSWVQNNAANATIYTDSPELVYYFLEDLKDAKNINLNYLPGKSNDIEFDELTSLIESTNGYVIFTDYRAYRSSYLINENLFENSPDYELLMALEDARIYAPIR